MLAAAVGKSCRANCLEQYLKSLDMINKVLRAAVRHQTPHLEHIAHGNYGSQSLTFINICHRAEIPVAYWTGSNVALTVMGFQLVEKWRRRNSSAFWKNYELDVCRISDFHSPVAER